MYKLGVVVPYRNRDEHLSEFIGSMKQYLTRKGIDFTLIIVEQDNDTAFNRGALCNIGYKEAKMLRCTHVVFHDVDMIPMNVDYSESDKPIHLASDDLPFESYFGGVTLFPIRDFAKINGFSNNYWGWGYEDDDLMHRCIQKGIELDSRVVKTKKVDKDIVIFNGINSFAKMKNVLNVRRDFTIKTSIVLGEMTFDGDKPSDVFPIFNISGYDFELAYTSFSRLVLKVFDSKTKFYQIYTDITKEKSFDIEIKHIAKLDSIFLKVNGKEVGRQKLESSIFNYNSVKSIFLGADNSLENFFSGIIKTFTILDEADNVVTELDSTKTVNYKIVDNNGSKNNAPLFNTSISKFDVDTKQRLYFPYRRKSRFRRLKHESSGFNGGRWESDLTRWNELRYHNEVCKGYADPNTDGLKNTKYKLHNRKRSEDRSVVKLNIGFNL